MKKSDPLNPAAALEKLYRLTLSQDPRLQPRWVKDLPRFFEEAGLNQVKSHVCRCSDRDSFGMHETNLLSYGMILGDKGDSKEARGKSILISEAAKESRMGAAFAVERLTVIGRKVESAGV